MLKYMDEYRDAALVGEISRRIKDISRKPLNIMEVCGGHTMAIRKSGIHKLIGDNVNLISGPGCPVCVTSLGDIDKAVALSKIDNVVICSFGDMYYVPGTGSSLLKASSEGADVRTVYSVHDVLEFAKEEADKNFVFLSIGFETTTPTTAAAVVQAKREGIKNLSILAMNKTMPAALKAVLASDDSKIDALICPGHVSTITGTEMYEFIVDELGVSCCVSGFEPADLLGAIYFLVEAEESGQAKLINAYERAVHPEGNIKAQDVVDEVFTPADVEWRGFGVIPSSGLKLKDEYSEFCAEKIYEIKVPASKEHPGCLCGDILRGSKKPVDCKLFKTSCTPMDPKGACMVSSEGTCAAWYKYGEN